MQGQDYVIVAQPCVESDVLLLYLEDVTKPLDLKLPKSKPHSVSRCKAYRASQIIFHPQKKSLGAVFARKLLHSGFRQGLPTILQAMLLQKGQEETTLKTRVDSNSNSSRA